MPTFFASTIESGLASKVIDEAAGRPIARKRANAPQSSGFPGLAFVGQADDAPGQFIVVALNGSRIDAAVTPPALAMACCFQEGGPPGRAPKLKPPPNSIITGTAAVTLAGTVKLAWMLTVILVSPLLSTWPDSFLVTMAISPLVPCVVSVTSQVTFGAFCGIRP